MNSKQKNPYNKHCSMQKSNSKQQQRSNKYNKSIKMFTQTVKQFTDNKSANRQFIDAIIADNSIIYIDECKNYAIVKTAYMDQLQRQISEGKKIFSKMAQIQQINVLIKFQIEGKIIENNKMKETIKQLAALNEQCMKRIQLIQSQADGQQKFLIEKLSKCKENQLKKLTLIRAKSDEKAQYTQTSFHQVKKMPTMQIQSCESITQNPSNQCFKGCFARQEKILYEMGKKIQLYHKQNTRYQTKDQQLENMKFEVEFYKSEYEKIFIQKESLKNKIEELERKIAENKLDQWKTHMANFVNRIEKQWYEFSGQVSPIFQHSRQPQNQESMTQKQKAEQLMLLKRMIQNPMVPQPLETYRSIQSMPKLDFEAYKQQYGVQEVFLNLHSIDKTPTKEEGSRIIDQQQHQMRNMGKGAQK